MTSLNSKHIRRMMSLLSYWSDTCCKKSRHNLRNSQTHADSRRLTQNHAESRRLTQTHADSHRITQNHADHTETLAYLSILALDSGEMTGPRSVPGRLPAETWGRKKGIGRVGRGEVDGRRSPSQRRESYNPSFMFKMPNTGGGTGNIS